MEGGWFLIKDVLLTFNRNIWNSVTIKTYGCPLGLGDGHILFTY